MESTPPPSAPTGPRPASKKRTETLRNARRLRSRCALSGDERQRKTAQPALWKRGERRGREELLHTKTAERRGDQNRGERDEEETGGERRGEERRGERGRDSCCALTAFRMAPHASASTLQRPRFASAERTDTRGRTEERRREERGDERRREGKEELPATLVTAALAGVHHLRARGDRTERREEGRGTRGKAVRARGKRQ